MVSNISIQHVISNKTGVYCSSTAKCHNICLSSFQHIFLSEKTQQWIHLILNQHITAQSHFIFINLYWLSVLLTNFKCRYFLYLVPFKNTVFFCAFVNKKNTFTQNSWIQIVKNNKHDIFACKLFALMWEDNLHLYFVRKKFESFDQVKHNEMLLRSMIKCCNKVEKKLVTIPRHCRKLLFHRYDNYGFLWTLFCSSAFVFELKPQQKKCDILKFVGMK